MARISARAPMSPRIRCKGEQMLRPDFTVPVVQMHMAERRRAGALYLFGRGVSPAGGRSRAGPANTFRWATRCWAAAAPAQADAEVFALMQGILAPLDLRAATGDIGILMAAVEGLDTTEARKAALRRHIWRPRRFRALIDRFSGRAPVPPSRAALLAAADPMAAAGPADRPARARPRSPRGSTRCAPMPRRRRSAEGEVGAARTRSGRARDMPQRAGAAARHRGRHARHRRRCCARCRRGWTRWQARGVDVASAGFRGVLWARADGILRRLRLWLYQRGASRPAARRHRAGAMTR